MASRKLNELATDLDDAVELVEELQEHVQPNPEEKLNDLHQKLEKASDNADDVVGEDV